MSNGVPENTEHRETEY